jgi:hypothetical protein
MAAIPTSLARNLRQQLRNKLSGSPFTPMFQEEV